ncbi:GNAT family N-acetyltransferase [Aminipila luticellarii]|uniref:N-acetyltransferase n=1 Tax=Aminipila luticellarii TaxID=2507160 RepID=A0A410PSC1_9FIRM|nr:GNAT family N-acetyltransferase [Aminipila luticellarii]QAT41789.1 N-acetyltransferase [Aminipila luticellarii]
MITYRNDIAVDDYLRLRDAVEWKKVPREQAEKALAGSVYMLVAYDDEKAVGMARVVGDGAYMALIVDVIVHPDYQKMKIGSYIINNIMNTLESSIKGDDIMMINLMSLQGKETFYEQFGLSARPNDNMGPGMTKWLNVK